MEWFHSTCSIIVALLVLLFSISMTKGVNREYQFDVNVQQQEASSMLHTCCCVFHQLLAVTALQKFDAINVAMANVLDVAVQQQEHCDGERAVPGWPMPGP